MKKAFVIVHLNGWPGSGKRTVGEALALRLGARFVHNHLLHDVAITCAGFDSLDRWPIYERVRAAAYDALRNRPGSEILVLTNALCRGAPREQDAWRHVVDLAVARAVALVPVTLDIETDENIRRLRSPNRVGRKLTDPAELLRYRGSAQLLRPSVPEAFAIDVTHVTPDQAAAEIQIRIAAISGLIRPATVAHLDLG